MLPIGPFTPSELPALRRLVTEYLLEFAPASDPSGYWDDAYEAAVLDGLRRGTLTIWLARNDAFPVAFAIVRIEQQWYRARARAGIVEEFYVAPAFRLQGVGRSLAEQALAWLRAQGVGEIRAPVVAGNLNALLFWQRLGFSTGAFLLYAPTS